MEGAFFSDFEVVLTTVLYLYIIIFLLMIIFNTTYHAHNDSIEQFLKWIKEEYIPTAIECGTLSNPQLALIMAQENNSEGRSYSLQFQVASIDELEKWYSHVGERLLQVMHTRFGSNVAGFSTIMSVIDL